MAKRATADEFVTKSRRIHGDTYIYDNVVYINDYSKVIITCQKHGNFEQIPTNHLRGKGCSKCGVDKNKEKLRSNTEEFIQKAISVHHNKYNYDKVIYSGAFSDVTIICQEHGNFEQRPDNHLHGKGCPQCGGGLKSSTEEFVKNARNIHGNKYNYDNVIYVNRKEKVSITCLQHGDFLQAPGAHLSQGQGCPKCVCNVSRIGNRWLDSLDIPNDPEHREVDRLISGRKFVVDGYMPDTNTVYEFYGDKAHGNPGKFNCDDKGPFGVTYGESYRKTVEREHIFRSAGYNLVTMWESDFRKYSEK